MKTRVALIFGLTLAALGTAAAPAPDWETLARRGDAAFDRGDYAAAAALYEQAQDRSTDPGRVVMGLAGAKYRLALASDADRARLAQEAEQAYRCCTGPGDPRRAEALFGLGDALLLKAGANDADDLKAAVAAYRQCLAQPGLDPRLADDARHDLERARLLLLQTAPAAGHAHDEPNDGDGPPKPPAPPDKSPGAPQNPSRDPSTAKVKPDPNGGRAKPEEGTKPTETDAAPPPGEGALPPVPDRADLPPPSAEDAARWLDRAARNIRQDLKEHRRARAPKPPSGVPDW